MLRPTAISAQPREDKTLLIVFDNGERGIFDVKPYIKGSYYGMLSDSSYFNSVTTNGFSVEWADGQDICPDELYHNSQKFTEA